MEARRRTRGRVKPGFKVFPIRTGSDYDKALKTIDSLAIKSRRSKFEQDVLEILTILIAKYEEDHCRIETSGISGVEALKHLLEENGLSGADLGRILGTRTQGYPILRGERPLSTDHMMKLGSYFAVSPGLFFDEVDVYPIR